MSDGRKILKGKGMTFVYYPSENNHTIEIVDATLTSEGNTKDWYTITSLLPSSGTHTLTWVGKDNETFVASISVRQELDPLYRDPTWLLTEYVEKERTMAEIAAQFGITPTAVNQWLNKHEIPTRSRGRRKDDN